MTFASVVSEPKITKFRKDGKLFLKTFLLDATKNENAWKVTPDSIRKNINTFVGMPLILDGKFDHPAWIEGGIDANAIHQQRFSVGPIDSIIEQAGIWYALSEIVDAAAQEIIEKHDFELYTSPRLIYNPENSKDAISDWMGFHLAIVDKPAYGVDKAAIKGACYGAAEQCRIALASAKKEDCGFCVKTQLLKLVSNVDAHVDSSQFTETEKSHSYMVDTTPTVPDLSGYVPKADYEKTRAEVETFKQANADLKKNFDEFKTSVEEERRKEKLTAVLSAKIEDKTVLSERIKYFVDAKVSPDVVETAYKDYPSITPKPDNTTKFQTPADAKTKPATWFAAQRSYERSLIK